MFGGVSGIVPFDQEGEFAFLIRGRNGGVGADDGFAFGVLECVWVGGFDDEAR